VKLLLACGDEQRPGFVHHDRVKHSPHIEVAWDLRVMPWPWADDSAEWIGAHHIIEHLPDLVGFMNECWRILAPGGRLVITAPHWQSENAWRDPTHVRAIHPDQFLYFDPDQDWHKTFGRFYTDRAWRVVRIWQDTETIEAVMEPRN